MNLQPSVISLVQQERGGVPGWNNTGILPLSLRTEYMCDIRLPVSEAHQPRSSVCGEHDPQETAFGCRRLNGGMDASHPPPTHSIYTILTMSMFLRPDITHTHTLS